MVGSPIAVGSTPFGIAIAPGGDRAYVANSIGKSVSVIDTATKQEVGSPIPVGTGPWSIAVTPDGARAYVANHNDGDVSILDTRTDQLVADPIAVGDSPDAVAIVPDQPPVASFSVSASRARPGVAVAFDAAASADPDGSIARFDWAFGDGRTALAGGRTTSHAYPAPGTYRVDLTLTDDEGCSTSLIFTGQTAHCNGSASASRSQTVSVAYPGVRVRCPRRARRHGCRFKLKAVTKKRRGKAETRLAKIKVKAGRSKVASLRPKKRFKSRLAVAGKILVKETIAIGHSRRTVLRRLKVVQ